MPLTKMGREVGALGMEGLKCEVEKTGHLAFINTHRLQFCCLLLRKHINISDSLMDPSKMVL